jgi:hypothetical protein
VPGQPCTELVVLVCDPELDWLPVDVDAVVVLVAAKAIPTEDSAAMTETARIEHVSALLVFSPKPSLKPIFSFHLLEHPRCVPVISNFQERPQIINGFSPNG